MDYDPWGTPGYPSRGRLAGDGRGAGATRPAESSRSPEAGGGRRARGERAPVWYGEDTAPEWAEQPTGAWSSAQERREWSTRRRRASRDEDGLTSTGSIPISPVPADGELDHRPGTVTGRARVPQTVAGLPAVPRQSRRRDWDVTSHSIERVEVPVVEGERQYLATMGWTGAWYAVPYALYAAWTLTFDAKPGMACAKPVNNACPPVRSMALTALLDGLPRIVVALAIALVIALLVRLGSGAWRPITTAFASAIIGAGLATILFSVLG